MKICIIASHLFNGGFTRSMLNMVHALKKNTEIQIDFLFLEPQSHQIDPSAVLAGNKIKNVETIDEKSISLKRKWQLAINRILLRRTLQEWKREKDPNKKNKKYVRSVQLKLKDRVLSRLPLLDLSEYDCVISWEENLCNDFLALNVTARKKIGYIHPEYEGACFDPSVDQSILSRLDHIVLISESSRKSFMHALPSLASKAVCIPNVMDAQDILRKAEQYIPYPKSRFDIVTVCRLDIATKGLDLLLKAAEMLQENQEDFHLYIIGDGQDRDKLQTMIQEADLKQVHLAGNQDNPYPWIKNADLFVLASRHEGKPLVIDEAEILDVPVLTTDYPGAFEQIDNHHNGIIVHRENVTELYQAMTELIHHRQKLDQMKKNLSSSAKKYDDISAFLKLIGETDD